MRQEELSSLTGIRFYAALLVFLYHAPQLIPGMSRMSEGNALFNAGDLGVAFFFVLSGFILTYNYAETFRDGVSGLAYRRFVWNRLTKIYPVHLLTLLLVLPIAIYSPQFPLDWRALPLHATLLQCFWPSADPPFSDYLNRPSWSISCEWFFYLLGPLAMFGVLEKRRRWVPVVMSIGYVLGLGAFLWQSQSDSVRLYFISRFAPSRFVEFVAGIFVARVFLMSPADLLGPRSRWMQAGGMALLLAALVYAPHAPWPLLGGGLLYLPGSILVILGLAYGRGRLSAHLSRRALKHLGTASFSLYLVHQPLLRAARGACLFFGWAVSSWLGFAVVLLLMFLVVQTAASLICYRFEMPLQRWLRSVDASRSLKSRAAVGCSSS